MIDIFAALLPPDIGGAATAFLLAMSFVGSFITAAFGIGGGILLLSVMAISLPPLAMVPVHGVVQLGSNIGRAAILARHALWSVLPAFGAGAVVGVAAGGAVATAVAPWVVQTGVGLFVAWSVISQPPRWLGRWPVVTGAVSSVLTMFFGATGPFVASYTKTLHLAREPYVATNATLMTLQHLLKTVAFAVLGFAFGPWLGFIAAMIGAGFLGTIAGSRVLRRMTDSRFHRVLDLVLLLIAARLIWSGLSTGLTLPV